MDRFEMNYTSRNIPVPSKESFKILLIPKTEELTEFECDLQLIIKNAVFKKVNNTFQTQILNDV